MCVSSAVAVSSPGLEDPDTRVDAARQVNRGASSRSVEGRNRRGEPRSHAAILYSILLSSVVYSFVRRKRGRRARLPKRLWFALGLCNVPPYERV